MAALFLPVVLSSSPLFNTIHGIRMSSSSPSPSSSSSSSSSPPSLSSPSPSSSSLSSPSPSSSSSQSLSSSSSSSSSASSSPLQYPERALIGRRQSLLIALSLAFSSALASSPGTEAAGISDKLNKYIKRKKLDPLDTYVPPVLLSQLQFEEIEVKLQEAKLDYGDARTLLRSGPAASLRTDIRAVAQYAEEAGNGKIAFAAVDDCIRALEDLDSLLFQAKRSISSASIETMKGKISTALGALNRLLSTVPDPILEKCKAITKSYKDQSLVLEQDDETKILESLL